MGIGCLFFSRSFVAIRITFQFNSAGLKEGLRLFNSKEKKYEILACVIESVLGISSAANICLDNKRFKSYL